MSASHRQIDEARLAAFEELAQTRRSTRHFSADPFPRDVLDRLLDCARWAPSGYNLQPTHFVVVDDDQLKASLAVACMDQAQVREAPYTIIFCGDLHVAANNFEEALASDKSIGAINEAYEEKLRKFVPLAFQKGPVGLNWAWKAFLPPFLRFFLRIPELPAVHTRRWLAKQVSLSAMNFMLAAHAAGLSTVPMEGFDTRRVAALLGLPSTIMPILVIPVGYGASATPPKKSRLPLERMTHRNHW